MIMEKFSEAITQITNKYHSIINDKIAVAISGGPDSTALTYILNQWALQNNKKLIAITVDHQLRSNSSREADEIHKQLAKCDIKHVILKWQHENITSNVQAKARNARYQLLTNYCQEQNISCLFVAHVKEDIAENFMIRLQRGSGLDGLSAIQEHQIVNQINIIRPFLKISKDAIKLYLVNNNIEWHEDPSNYNKAFTRARIREELSGNNQYIDRICLASHHLRMVKNFLDTITNQYFKDIVRITKYGIAIVNRDILLKCDDYVISTILTKTLQIISCSLYKARYISLENLIMKIKNGDFQHANLMNCNIIYKKSVGIIISSALVKNLNTAIKSDYLIWNNRFEIKIPKTINYSNMSVTALDKHIWQNLDKTKVIYNSEMKSMPKLSLFSLPVFKNLEIIVAIPYLNYYTEDIYKEIEINYICTNNI